MGQGYADVVTSWAQGVCGMAEEERSSGNGRSLSLSNPAVLLFLAAQTVGGIWWAATMTAKMEGLGRAMEMQEIRRQSEMDQFKQEVKSNAVELRADVETLKTYNQNLREKLAARGILNVR